MVANAFYREGDRQSQLITWLLVSYVFLLPIQFQTGLGFRFAPSDVCLLFILLLGLGQLKLLGTAWSSWHFGIVITFCIGTYVSLVEKGHVSISTFILKDLGLMALIASYIVLTTYMDSWNKLRRIMKVFLLSVVFQNLLALGVYVSGIELSWMNVFHPRVSGMLVDPNAYGGLLVTAFAFHVVTYYSKQPLIGGLWGALSTVTLAAGIMLTFSRSAWIGMVLVLLVMLVMRPVYLWRTALVFVMAFVLTMIYFGEQFTEFMGSMASRPAQIQSRVDILVDAAHMFSENPLLGVGLGTFAEQEAIIIHNTPMWFLTEFGLFGFIIFICFIAWFVMKALHAHRMCGDSDKAFVLALLLSHVAMIGLSMGIEAFYQRHWWLIFALIASAFRILHEKEGVVEDRLDGRLVTVPTVSQFGDYEYGRK